MKYVLKNKSLPNFSDNYMRDYLQSLGIYEYEKFTNCPAIEDEISPYCLDEISKASSIFYKHIKNNSKIFLVVDSDADGYTSSAIIYQLISNLSDCEIQVYMHEGKEHGVVVNSVPEDIGLIIIPDAGSNQFDELQTLSQKHDIIVLDHHEVEQGKLFAAENVAIVNNQLSKNFHNESLSGAGVAFKFAQYILENENIDASQWYDLAALGIISDMMLITTLDNNYIIRKGKNIVNPMFKALLEQQAYSVSSTTSPTPIDIAFYITPLINGVIRMNDQELKLDLFMGFANPNYTEISTRVFRGQEKQETHYQRVAREAYNIKNRQNKILETTMDNISNEIETKGLDKNAILIYQTSLTNPDEVPKTLTGLMAMKLSQKYNKPTLVLRPIQENDIQYYRGSGRGKNATGFTSFKDYLNETGLVDFAQGHAMAFGCGVKETVIETLINTANEQLKDVDFGESISEVNYIFNNSNINYNMLFEFGKYISIYGNGIPQPSFAFELIVPRSSINIIGKKMDTVRIQYNNINFIKFQAKALAEELSFLPDGTYSIQIVGRSQLNEFRGATDLQIMVDDIEFKKVEIGDLL